MDEVKLLYGSRVSHLVICVFKSFAEGENTAPRSVASNSVTTTITTIKINNNYKSSHTHFASDIN